MTASSPPPSLPQRKGMPINSDLKEVRSYRNFASFRTIGALVLREVQTSSSRTTGGFVWAILEPVGGILLLTLIFSAGFRTPPIGSNFAIFYATGVVPFMAYMDISNKVASTIKSSKGLLAYPAVTFMDVILARIIFNTVTQFIVASIIFIGTIVAMDTRTDPQVESIAVGFLMYILFSFAIGSLNCFLFEAFSWWQPVWGILMRPLFLLSCIFFIYDDVPDLYKDWLWWNPLVHIIGQMRHAFYPSYVGDYISYTYVFSVSLCLLALGLIFLIRYHRDLQNS